MGQKIEFVHILGRNQKLAVPFFVPVGGGEVCKKILLQPFSLENGDQIMLYHDPLSKQIRAFPFVNIKV